MIKSYHSLLICWFLYRLSVLRGLAFPTFHVNMLRIQVAQCNLQDSPHDISSTHGDQWTFPQLGSGATNGQGIGSRSMETGCWVIVLFLEMENISLKHYMFRNWNAKQSLKEIYLKNLKILDCFCCIGFLSWRNTKAIHSTSNWTGNPRKLDNLCNLSLQPSHLICPIIFCQRAYVHGVVDYMVLKGMHNHALDKTKKIDRSDRWEKTFWHRSHKQGK